MMCYYLNVQFQGKRVNLPQGKLLEVFEIKKKKKNFFLSGIERRIFHPEASSLHRIRYSRSYY